MPWAGSVRGIARDLGITVVAGMFTPGQDGRVRNTLLVTGPGVETSYDKIHLFDAFGFAESDTVDAGTAPVTFEVDGTTFGLATCYDVRFPALFTANARAGAQVNIVCASWGAGEGKGGAVGPAGPGPCLGQHHLRGGLRPGRSRQRRNRKPSATLPPASATAPSFPLWGHRWWRWAANRNWPSSTSTRQQ